MKQIKSLIVFGLIIYSLSACNKTSDRNRITKEQAKTILEESLSDSTVHNIIGSNTILTKKEKAIEFAEFILFDTYGKKNIENQKPYDIYEIDEYWIISGTLTKGTDGGTFMIIIDSRNYKVLRLTHGK